MTCQFCPQKITPSENVNYCHYWYTYSANLVIVHYIFGHRPFVRIFLNFSVNIIFVQHVTVCSRNVNLPTWYTIGLVNGNPPPDQLMCLNVVSELLPPSAFSINLPCFMNYCCIYKYFHSSGTLRCTFKHTILWTCKFDV